MRISRPRRLLARLREGARPFPTAVADDPTIQACHVPVNDQDFQLAQCLCTTSTCGAGMANAANSRRGGRSAHRRRCGCRRMSPPGQNVTLNASGSAAACGRTVASFRVDGGVDPLTNPPAIVGADTSTATVIAPSSRVDHRCASR